MTDDLIIEAARLMEEQIRDYARLDSACQRLSETLVTGDAAAIDSTTRSGEVALLEMRARLVRIIQALTAFSDARTEAKESIKLGLDARARFEAASNALLLAAKQFQRTRARAAALTTSGATFATYCIEVCGIQPTTYKAPYARGEGRPWA
jgi:hypothetical protein